jgi:GTP-binding nuclear protein Ran
MATTIVLLGDGGVGKTSYITKLTTGKFEPQYVPTTIEGMGIHLYDKKNVLLVDTPGQWKYNEIFDSVCEDAHGFLIFFSLASTVSFKSCEKWIAKAKKGSPRATIVLVGTKEDVSPRKVSLASIQELQYKYSLSTFSITSKCDDNFDKLLECATY